ncbi:MAG: hypothetical protein KDC53_18305 [Saprospiraceae bacterium]|nr:hypothetical protein [Saprospiraceae bacterium]
MKRLYFTLTLLLSFSMMAFSQTEPEKQEPSLNKEWKEAMEEVENSLKDIKIPEVDVDRIMDEVREAMPTREEMESYKEIVADAVGELKNIDFSELERAMNNLGKELENLFKDHQKKENNDPGKKTKEK